MHSKQQFFNSLTQIISRAATAALAMPIMFVLAVVLTQPSPAQTFKVLYNFTGGADGASPMAGLTMDAAGNFYGTTSTTNGSSSGGAVFKLTHSGSRWILTPLYSFPRDGGKDGTSPRGRVILARDGTLYGTTLEGGGYLCSYLGGGCGTVFQLRPSAPDLTGVLAAPWDETVLHRFNRSDGMYPQGDLSLDQSGNIYGTTLQGGDASQGVIYKLTPSGGSWTETVLYAAQDNGDGKWPYGGVVLDSSGNLIGVFGYGGPYNNGAVYQLSPSKSGWTERTVYGFTGESDGGGPIGGLIPDSSGNFYGTTAGGGTGGGGTVFKLKRTDSGWTLETLYGSWTPYVGNSGPWDKLAMDAAGNLYGTTFFDGTYLGCGSVFKLTPSNGGWTYTSLHDFTCGSDGANPISNLVMDGRGNLYGTTYLGGTDGCGVVFEITP